MTDLFVWQVYEQGEWGTLSVLTLGDIPFSPIPLMTRSRRLADGAFRTAAQNHHWQTGLMVRLVRFELKETLELLEVE